MSAIIIFFLTLHYVMHVWANNKPAPPLASQGPLQQCLAVPCLLGSMQEWQETQTLATEQTNVEP